MDASQEDPVTDLATTTEATNIEVTVKLNAELLAEALRQVSASSAEEVIDEALWRLVDAERAKRRAALDALRKMVDDGEVTFPEHDEADR